MTPAFPEKFDAVLYQLAEARAVVAAALAAQDKVRRELVQLLQYEVREGREAEAERVPWDVF